MKVKDFKILFYTLPLGYILECGYELVCVCVCEFYAKNIDELPYCVSPVHYILHWGLQQEENC